MVQSIKKYISLSLVLVVTILIAVACANMATPTGGPVDLDPPKVYVVRRVLMQLVWRKENNDRFR
jgi:hypothetical protein